MDDVRVFAIMRNLSLAPHLQEYCCEFCQEPRLVVLVDFRQDCVGSWCFPAGNLLQDPDVLGPEKEAVILTATDTVGIQHSSLRSTVCPDAGDEVNKDNYLVHLRHSCQEGVQVLVEFVLCRIRARHWGSVGADDGGELVSPERQEEAHQAIIATLRQKGQMSRDVFSGWQSRHQRRVALPLIDCSRRRLNTGTCFTKLDLSYAYLHIEFTEEFYELLTIDTQCGFFQFIWWPFDVKSAPASFQQTMDTILMGSDGAAPQLDYIIVNGSNPSELLQPLESVLNRMQEYGSCLRLGKFHPFKSSVKYLRFKRDQDGRYPDPDTIDPMKQLPPPKDIKAFRPFFGPTSHYNLFLPKVHHFRHFMN
ncbi:unnamed protein product [Schistocephalus solidus]|uniref:Reverse transcriptase domain-containing protein n=1 Tax=Schistocephalus solidus TaxID=70667 RepID=A0A183TP51_SCHSO|nr:unnamed protein product [Schistocephalus solidus]